MGLPVERDHVVTDLMAGGKEESGDIGLGEHTPLGQGLVKDAGDTLLTDLRERLALGQGLEVAVSQEIEEHGNLWDLLHRLEGMFAAIMSDCHPEQLTGLDAGERLNELLDGVQDTIHHGLGKEQLVPEAEFGSEQLKEHVVEGPVPKGAKDSLAIGHCAHHATFFPWMEEGVIAGAGL